jgi:hypothetical protein
MNLSKLVSKGFLLSIFCGRGSWRQLSIYTRLNLLHTYIIMNDTGRIVPNQSISWPRMESESVNGEHEACKCFRQAQRRGTAKLSALLDSKVTFLLGISGHLEFALLSGDGSHVDSPTILTAKRYISSKSTSPRD